MDEGEAQGKEEGIVSQVEHPSTPERSELPSGRPAPRRASGGRLFLVLLAVVFFVAAILSLARRRRDARVLAEETVRLDTPTVAIVRPQIEPAEQELVLPGSVEAWVASPVYARTSGYLLHWTHDIGSRVRQGELLATIDTPEIDQQLVQARAIRQQVVAQLHLARISAQRWQTLRRTDSVSQQEADQKQSDLQQAEADLAAANANVRRLEQLESFKRVTAPGSGVITRRNIDVGGLVNAGNGGANRELFDVARVDMLRVFVDVPQTHAFQVRRGLHAWLTLREFPGRRFTGSVARTADAIDPATRTLRTEVDLPNQDGTLLPGVFAEVHFAVHDSGQRLTIPANAMLFRAEGARAAIVTGNGRIHLQHIDIGRDLGTKLEILDGLQSTDNVVLNPPDSLEEGEAVRIANPGGPS